MHYTEKNIQNFFTKYEFWTPERLPIQKRDIIKEALPNIYTRSASRTLSSILYSVYSDYYNWYRAPAYLHALLYFYLQSRIHISSQYINEDTARNYTKEQIQITLLTPILEQHPTIQYIAVGKNYSVVRDACIEFETQATETNYTRFKGYENLLLINKSHFLRIYRTEINGKPIITIYSNMWHKNLIYGIMSLLPILFPNTHPEYNAQYQILLQAYQKLYSLIFVDETYNTLINDASTNNDLIKNYFGELMRIIKEYLTAFQNISPDITVFFNTASKQFKQNYMRTKNDELRTIESRILTAETDLQRYCARKGALNKELALADSLIDTDYSVLKENLTTNKCITITAATNNYIDCLVCAPLQYFDATIFEQYEARENSTLNERYKDSPELRQLLHHIFIIKDYKLLICCPVRLQTNSSTIISINARGNSYHDITELPTIVNPHLFYYDCWSEARAQLTKIITEQKFELYVPQLISAVQTINVAEAPTFLNHFLQDFKRQDCAKQIINPNGKIINIAEALTELSVTQKATPTEEYTQIVLNEEEINEENMADTEA